MQSVPGVKKKTTEGPKDRGLMSANQDFTPNCPPGAEQVHTEFPSQQQDIH